VTELLKDLYLRDRIALLVVMLGLFAIITLGPGLITRPDMTYCSPDKVGCATPAVYHAGDGRVAGGAGDLIILYCQPDPPRVDVYTVAGGSGIFLASFKLDDLRAAGPTGQTVDLADKGALSMTVLPSGTLYVAAKGGMIAAAGLNSYAKLFNCPAQG
jgi:hypothetical protein